MENSIAPITTRQVVFVTHNEGGRFFPYIVWIHELKEALETGRLFGRDLTAIYYNGGKAAYDFKLKQVRGGMDLEIFRWPCPGMQHNEKTTDACKKV
jgi:hypothetical protein